MKKKIFRYCFIFFFLLLFFKIENVYAYTEKECRYTDGENILKVYQDAKGEISFYYDSDSAGELKYSNIKLENDPNIGILEEGCFKYLQEEDIGSTHHLTLSNKEISESDKNFIYVYNFSEEIIHETPSISDENESNGGNLISQNGTCPEIIKPIVKLIKIAFLPLITYLVPVALIIMGSFDYVKAVAANSEEETKKAQKVFIKRLIQAALIFLIVNIVTIVFNIVASSTGNSNINSAANKWLDCWLDDKSQNNLLECKNYCDKKYPSGGEELSNCMIQCNK